MDKQYWFQNGKLHRDNDLPAVVYANGDQIWYQNGKRHRDKYHILDHTIN